jgi:hypothetical protein
MVENAKGKNMVKEKFFGMSAVALALGLVLAGCTTTNYLEIITPHTAVDLLSDDVRVFEGKSYDEAAVKAGEAGFELILSYEGRNYQGVLGSPVGSVRIIAKDADGIRRRAAAPVDSAEADASAANFEVKE